MTALPAPPEPALDDVPADSVPADSVPADGVPADGVPSWTPPPDDVLRRVRSLVRDRGTDPLADPGAVKAAILDALDEVPEGDVTAAEVVSWAQDLHDEVAGYGPLQRLFDDADVEEVWFKYRLASGL